MKKLVCVGLLLIAAALLFGDSPHSFSFSESFVNETGTLPTTTLFTSTTGGDFIVTLYVENTTATPSAQVQATLSWTDDVNTRQASVPAIASGFNSNSQVFSVHMLPNQSLILNATDFGGAQTYTIYVTAR